MGDTLALGIAEAVLHQLASLRELTVVARTSSFVYKDHNGDARDIGRRLGAHYLLEGSVQYEQEKMRVTAQLIDATSGRQVWSVRVDRPARDVFAVQDEIALEVARTLKLSLDASTTDKLTGQGTTNFDAYLAYLQGRALAATLRIPQLKEAITQFTRACRIDPSFAAAYVELAEAQRFVAEFGTSADRQEDFEAAVEHGKELLEHALQLDPNNGHAYAQRAYLRAFSDLAGAEADYRRGIELSPNYAKAYAGLAAVLNENPARSAEALEALDHARRLDPLEPEYDVTKAVFLFYRRSEARAANDLLLDVLQREPLYQPALARLGEVRWRLGRFAEAIKYGEQALALDPYAEWTRRYLVRAYLDLGDPDAAARVIAASPRAMPVRSLPLQVYRREWSSAAAVAYAAEEDDALSPLDERFVTAALRTQARTTGQYSRGINVLERVANVSWDGAGQPHLPTRLGIRSAAIGLADLLIRSGDRPRGERLLKALLADMDHATKALAQGSLWSMHDRPLALALLGDMEAAMQTLQIEFVDSSAVPDSWLVLEREPAYEGLHDDSRFKRLLTSMRVHVQNERKELQRLRDEGLVPAQMAARAP
jgi:TolB-like protein